MNVIGEKLTVLTSSDPTKSGRSGRVLLETANTLLIDEGGRTLRVEKAGAAFLMIDSGKVVTGPDIAGRLQDRVGKQRA
ncbi:MAG TPA: ribonuclease P protein subunit [Nitrososphaerales archaeon]|nr:ribonuclease P protein subunit [Nitrososphaerales archaeon]